MAQSLGLSVTAEGIETAEQARLLREWSCQTGQGGVFSPALYLQKSSPRFFIGLLPVPAAAILRGLHYESTLTYAPVLPVERPLVSSAPQLHGSPGSRHVSRRLTSCRPGFPCRPPRSRLWWWAMSLSDVRPPQYGCGWNWEEAYEKAR